MLERLHALAQRREDFALETTLAARWYYSRLNGLREAGYRLHLYYFWLVNADLAVARVQARVQSGGHAIPEPTIRTRYLRSLSNLFSLYLPIADSWIVYDNSREGLPQIVAQGYDGRSEVLDPHTWALM